MNCCSAEVSSTLRAHEMSYRSQQAGYGAGGLKHESSFNAFASALSSAADGASNDEPNENCDLNTRDASVQGAALRGRRVQAAEIEAGPQGEDAVFIGQQRTSLT